jgi:hypothetical protein
MELGKTFLQSARAPLQGSAGRFRMNLIGDGVRLLAQDDLQKGLERGLDDVAKVARTTPAAVRGLAPMDELSAIASRLSQNQPAALAAVRRDDHTVTAFGPVPPSTDPVEHLDDLAKHFARDRAIASALELLATDLREWQRLLDETASRFDGDPRLERTHRRSKVLTAVLMACAAIVVLVPGVTGLVALRRAAADTERREASAAESLRRKTEASARIDAALASADPCTPGDVPADDAPFASAEQSARLAERTRSCAEAKTARVREQECTALAARLANKETFTAAEGLDQRGADLLNRVSTGTITVSDLALAGEAMPCAGTAAQKELWRAFAVASKDAIPVWMKLDAISPAVAKAMIDNGAPSPAVRRAFAFQVERIATTALQKPTPENIAKARGVCGFKADLGLALAMSCRKVP